MDSGTNITQDHYYSIITVGVNNMLTQEQSICMFINFFFEKKYLEKYLALNMRFTKIKLLRVFFHHVKAGNIWLLVWVGVLGQLLVKEFVDDGGDVGGLQILGLHPDLVPPLNIGLHLF